MNPFGRRSVTGGEDFDRILHLPTRASFDPKQLAREMTEALRTPSGTMSLRPVQAQALYELLAYGGLLAPMGVGTGKCLGRGTLVLMFDGTTKAVEDVRPGDVLMGPDSGPRRVVSTCRGVEPLYRVVPVKGEPYVVNESHILSLKQTPRGGGSAPSRRGGRVLNLEVREFLKRSGMSRQFRTNWKGWRTGVDFPHAKVDDPYMLGAWLGDGSSDTPSITTADPEIVEEVLAFAKRRGVEVRVQPLPKNRSQTYHFTTSSRPGRGGWNANPVTAWLRGLGVLGNKHVPHDYKANDRRVRLEVLAGLLDTDGALTSGGFDYVSVREVLADDVCFLARSLGLAAYKSRCKKTCRNNGVEGQYFRVSISGDCSEIPTRIPRKRAPKRRQKKSVLMTGIRVEPVGDGEYFGFELDGADRLFLLGDFTVTHNTLVFLLASVVLGLKRAIGLLPASLIEKTERERRELLKHWRLDKGLQLFSYEMLGRESSSTWLEQKRPDGIITDESHRLKNPKAACTRRVKRWMHDHPETKFVAMSGTLTKNSLRDFAHLARWSLTPEGAPVPQQEGELQEWADALDERVQPLKRLKPGVLVRLAKKEDIVEGDDTATARRAFHRRLVETPGVVCSLNAEQVDCSLSVTARILDVSAETEAHFKRLRETWELPDGWMLSEAVDVWRHARELAVGMHYAWDPRPPEKWLEARREWARFVRDVLSRSRTLDTEKQVRSAVLAGELPTGEATWRAWDEIRPTFTVNQKAVWHDTSALDFCASWMKKNVGIVWTEHTFFGHELARRTGYGYFGQNGLDQKGRSILDAEGPIIASIAANGTGKNLQRYSRNLITACPTGAAVWEQLLGRTHRPGQMADEVTAEVLVGCIEHVEAWARAVAEAEMARDLFGQPQKVLYADVDMPKAGDVRGGGARWTKTSSAKGE